MTVRVALPDLISPSYFPAIAAVELGFFRREGLDAEIELVFPVTQTFDDLRTGKVDFVAGSAHAALYAFNDWAGCRLLCALSQNMYWFLVVRSDLKPARGVLSILKGLRIAAAPGPVDGLRRMLHAVGMVPDEDVELVPVPGSSGTGVSFGVSAARALEEGAVDGFWANGMGARVALNKGVGELLVDARRGDGPPGSTEYTFAALVATEERIATRPDEAASAVRAVVAAQKALQEDPSLAQTAAASLFPEEERELIADLIRLDTPFYDPAIPPTKVAALNRFSSDIGILTQHMVPYEQVVALQFESLWGSDPH